MFLPCCSTTTSRARMRGASNRPSSMHVDDYERQKGPGPPANKNITSGSKVGGGQGQPGSPRRTNSGGTARPAVKASAKSEPAVSVSPPHVLLHPALFGALCLIAPRLTWKYCSVTTDRQLDLWPVPRNPASWWYYPSSSETLLSSSQSYKGICISSVVR